MFDFKQFCIDYNIPFWTEGKNCQMGWIQVKCVFCSDKSNHLGFNLKKNYLNCWKCGNNKLTDFIKFYTDEPSYQILKRYEGSAYIKKKVNKKKNNYKDSLELPGKELQKMHKDYLKKRRYNPDFIIKKYKITGGGIAGNYKYRIIIPIYFKNKIVSYQTRDITNKQKLRYKACNKEKELIHHKHILYNLDNCNNNYIIIVEGIFDVWRIGDNSACTFGTGYTIEQVNLIKKYDKIFVIYDNEREAQKKAKELCNQLSSLSKIVYNIQFDENKDPDDLNHDEILDLKKKLTIK